MRWIVLALALLLAPTAASAQCNGVFGANQVCGVGPAGGPPGPIALPSAGGVTGTGVTQDLPVWTSTTNIGDSGIYSAPAGNLTLFASAVGSDTNNKCISSGAPCTLKGACVQRSKIATFLANGNVTISIADGTINAVDGNGALCSVVGNGGGSTSIATTIQGNCSSPGNVILAIPNNSIGIFSKNFGPVVAKCLHMTGGNNAIAVSGAQYSLVDIDTITLDSWGTGGIGFNFQQGALMNILTNLTITTPIATPFAFSVGAQLNTASGSTLTLTGTPAWAGQFIAASSGAIINLANLVITGSATGKKGTFTGPGYIATGGVALNTFLPGNSPVSKILCFMDDAVEADTTGQCLNVAMPAATRNGDLAYWNAGASSWWQTLVGNNSGTQCFTESSSGVPSWTPCGGALAALGVGTGLSSNGTNLNSNAQVIDSFAPGLVAAIINTKGAFTTWPKASTVDNIAVSATSFTCTGNPTVTFYECGTSPTCSAPTVIGGVQITAGGTAVSATTLSSTAINAGDYTAWAISAGTCASLDIFGKAMAHSN